MKIKFLTCQVTSVFSMVITLSQGGDISNIHSKWNHLSETLVMLVNLNSQHKNHNIPDMTVKDWIECQLFFHPLCSAIKTSLYKRSKDKQPLHLWESPMRSWGSSWSLGYITTLFLCKMPSYHQLTTGHYSRILTRWERSMCNWTMCELFVVNPLFICYNITALYKIINVWYCYNVIQLKRLMFESICVLVAQIACFLQTLFCQSYHYVAFTFQTSQLLLLASIYFLKWS